MGVTCVEHLALQKVRVEVDALGVTSRFVRQTTIQRT